jgi:hypothetical protein
LSSVLEFFRSGRVVPRREFRQPRIHERVELMPLAGIRSFTSSVIGRSARGLSLYCPSEISPGSQVRLDMSDMCVYGTVTTCAASGNVWKLDVELRHDRALELVFPAETPTLL